MSGVITKGDMLKSVAEAAGISRAQAEKAVNIDWHLRNTVAKSIDDLGHQYNARDLLSAYQHGLETAAQQAGRGRHFYGNALKAAAAMVRPIPYPLAPAES